VYSRRIVLGAGIVHLALPRLTVWDFPAAMNEFGH
jgi:hypothetical protein